LTEQLAFAQALNSRLTADHHT